MTRIAVLRRVDGLFAWRIARGQEGFVTELAPLSFEREPEHRELLQAWDALGAVREIRAEVLEAVRCVLLATVLDPEGERPTLERLEIAPPPPEHKATAANPRAYQGTKDRPPKPRRPEPRDLRPFLCVRGGQDRLVQLLMRELGPIDLPAEVRTAPPGFYRGLGWFAHIMPEHYEGALAVHHALDLERDLTLRYVVALFLRNGFGDRIAWLRVAVGMAPPLRVPFLDLLTELGCWREAPESVRKQLTKLAAACTETNFELRMRYALSVVQADDRLEDAMLAMELADLHAPDFRFLQRNEDYYTPLAKDAWPQLQVFVSAYYDEPEWEVMSAWQACCKDPVLAGELAFIGDACLDTEAAQFLGRVLTSAILYADRPLRTWQPWQQQLRQFVAVIRAVRYPSKAVDLLDELVSEGTYAHLPSILALAHRCCAEPLAKDSAIATAVERFGIADARTQAALLRAPTQSFAVLDQQCARRDDAWAIGCAFDSFLKHGAEWFVAAFVQQPRTLCRSAHTVGLFARPQRHAIVKQAMASPLALVASDCSAVEFAARFDLHGPKTMTSPIPKKLRQHLAGQVILSDAQLERAARVIRSAWPAVVAEHIHELALAHMARNLGSDSVDLAALNQQMVHALKLQTGLDVNQRSLRRLLRACYRGDRDYLQQHPRNRAWLQQHAAVSEPWCQGITLSRDLKDHGTVTLTIENEPLEALRLGTYVGSCYGLGGGFMWSAAAVVLDINKQVVFARDAQQRCLARQILAITDDDKLACYSVYPESNPEMLALFADFDQAFAKHLGIPIESATTDEHVTTLLATKWWQDGLWDVSTVPGQKTTNSSQA